MDSKRPPPDLRRNRDVPIVFYRSRPSIGIPYRAYSPDRVASIVRWPPPTYWNDSYFSGVGPANSQQRPVDHFGLRPPLYPSVPDWNSPYFTSGGQPFSQPPPAWFSQRNSATVSDSRGGNGTMPPREMDQLVGDNLLAQLSAEGGPVIRIGNIELHIDRTYTEDPSFPPTSCRSLPRFGTIEPPRRSTSEVEASSSGLPFSRFDYENPEFIQAIVNLGAAFREQRRSNAFRQSEMDNQQPGGSSTAQADNIEMIAIDGDNMYFHFDDPNRRRDIPYRTVSPHILANFTRREAPQFYQAALRLAGVQTYPQSDSPSVSRTSMAPDLTLPAAGPICSTESSMITVPSSSGIRALTQSMLADQSSPIHSTQPTCSSGDQAPPQSPRGMSSPSTPPPLELETHPPAADVEVDQTRTPTTLKSSQALIAEARKRLALAKRVQRYIQGNEGEEIEIDAVGFKQLVGDALDLEDSDAENKQCLDDLLEKLSQESLGKGEVIENLRELARLLSIRTGEDAILDRSCDAETKQGEIYTERCLFKGECSSNSQPLVFGSSEVIGDSSFAQSPAHLRAAVLEPQHDGEAALGLQNRFNEELVEESNEVSELGAQPGEIQQDPDWDPRSKDLPTFIASQIVKQEKERKNP